MTEKVAHVHIMLWHLESEVKLPATKYLCIQSMLTITSLATLSAVFFWYVEEEEQK